MSSAIDRVAASEPVGDPHQLAERRHRRLAVAAGHPLRDVEDQIDRRLHQLPRQLGVGLEQHHL
ncbi:MAG TPA: hypothetical protein VLC06_17745, partial [Polyangia bacterium]|nr:hypothetical protein [Polyangia bacterium]